MLSKKNKNGVEATEIVGKGSKAFRDLFGEVEDARQSIEIVHEIRKSEPIGLKGDYHPFAKYQLIKHPFGK